MFGLAMRVHVENALQTFHAPHAMATEGRYVELTLNKVVLAECGW